MAPHSRCSCGQRFFSVPHDFSHNSMPTCVLQGSLKGETASRDSCSGSTCAGTEFELKGQVNQWMSLGERKRRSMAAGYTFGGLYADSSVTPLCAMRMFAVRERTGRAGDDLSLGHVICSYLEKSREDIFMVMRCKLCRGWRRRQPDSPGVRAVRPLVKSDRSCLEWPFGGNHGEDTGIVVRLVPTGGMCQ